MTRFWSHPSIENQIPDMLPACLVLVDMRTSCPCFLSERFTTTAESRFCTALKLALALLRVLACAENVGILGTEKRSCSSSKPTVTPISPPTFSARYCIEGDIHIHAVNMVASLQIASLDNSASHESV